MRHLNPKADLTFKKVFGEHPNQVKSLLNALLPFDKPEEEIVGVEYLPNNALRSDPWRRNCLLNMVCRNKGGQSYMVEILMMWSSMFRGRVGFHASKAYVRRLEVLDKGALKVPQLTQPLYSINLVNEAFDSNSDTWYHYYPQVYAEDTDKVIEGLRFIFVELPKFTPYTYNEKKMQVLWLRYLTEIDEETRQVPQELLDNPEIHQAVTQIEESAFSDAQLLGYDAFWDSVRVENTLISDALKKGLEQGREQGRMEERLSTARKLKGLGISPDTIAQATGLSAEEIERL